jgi:hypothetical protein
MAQHVTFPESWRRKDYASELFECINGVVLQNVMNQFLNPLFNTLIAGERTGISVIEMLISYKKLHS